MKGGGSLRGGGDWLTEGGSGGLTEWGLTTGGCGDSCYSYNNKETYLCLRLRYVVCRILWLNHLSPPSISEIDLAINEWAWPCGRRKNKDLENMKAWDWRENPSSFSFYFVKKNIKIIQPLFF